MQVPECGAFVVSLDFELAWGVLDHENVNGYLNNVRNVRNVIPALLSIFEKYGIHATWGVVGMIANRDLAEWEERQPEIYPKYIESRYSPYASIEKVKQLEPVNLFAEDLIRQISQSSGQEIGSHTYSHYYCGYEGQTEEALDCDLKLARAAMQGYSGQLVSIIFPRNQFNDAYADCLKKNGFQNYRGNERNWFNDPRPATGVVLLAMRGARLLDNYVDLSGHNCYQYEDIKDGNGLNNIRSSRFLRPYSNQLSFLEPIRLRRIKGQMRYAATHNCVFHLWWHPHNFGVNTEENLNNLEILLDYYTSLKKQYGMHSFNMAELGELLK